MPHITIPVVQLTEEGELIAKFPSIISAAHTVFPENSNNAAIAINNCIHKKHKSYRQYYKGFLWAKQDEWEVDQILKRREEEKVNEHRNSQPGAK